MYPFFITCIKTVFESELDILIVFCHKDSSEYLSPLLRLGEQQISELTLSNHHYLLELFLIDFEQIFYGIFNRLKTFHRCFSLFIEHSCFLLMNSAFSAQLFSFI